MAALKAHIAQKNIKMAGEPPAAPSLKASDEGVEVSCPIGNGEEQESDGVECKSTSGNRLSSDSVDLSNFNTTDVSVQVNHGTTTSKPINTPSRCMRWIRRARMVLRRGSNGYEVAPNASHEPCEEEKGNDNLVEKDNVIILPSSIATATEWECYFQAVWIRRQWRVSLMLVFSFVTFAGAAIFYYTFNNKSAASEGFALCLIFFGIVTFAMMLLENRRANGDLSLPPDIVFDRYERNSQVFLLRYDSSCDFRKLISK
eukprot:jgi/Bigna1/68027/fgenesh1_pg.5_\